MRIQVLSDLHLEAAPEFKAIAAPHSDVLVLAGDIGSYQSKSQLLDGPWADADFGLGQFSPFRGWPTPVLYVPGNHEYDGFDFDEAHARLRATCDRLGIIFLERSQWLAPWKDVHGCPVRFVGTTLWSDFDALAPEPKLDTPPSASVDLTPQALAQQLNAHKQAHEQAHEQAHKQAHVKAREKAREKAFRAANYYLQKSATTRNGQPFLAASIREHAIQCQRWLTDTLNQPFEGSTVVVTHFAPSLHSADPRYGRTPSTAGFCNALDHLLPHAKLWIHGHLHAPSDYRHNNCRVVANPLGYSRKKEQVHFSAQQMYEL